MMQSTKRHMIIMYCQNDSFFLQKLKREVFHRRKKVTKIYVAITSVDAYFFYSLLGHTGKVGGPNCFGWLYAKKNHEPLVSEGVRYLTDSAAEHLQEDLHSCFLPLSGKG